MSAKTWVMILLGWAILIEIIILAIAFFKKRSNKTK